GPVRHRLTRRSLARVATLRAHAIKQSARVAKTPGRCPGTLASSHRRRPEQVTGTNESNSALGMSARVRVTIALGVTAAAAVFATVAVGSASARSAAPAGTYLGKLDGTSAFVAVLVGDTGRIRAYALNSSERLAAWAADGLSEARSREERIGTPY